MGERKVLNRYFPPDFDPLLVPKRKYDPREADRNHPFAHGAPGGVMKKFVVFYCYYYYAVQQSLVLPAVVAGGSSSSYYNCYVAEQSSSIGFCMGGAPHSPAHGSHIDGPPWKKIQKMQENISNTLKIH